MDEAILFGFLRKFHLWLKTKSGEGAERGEAKKGSPKRYVFQKVRSVWNYGIRAESDL